MDSEKTVAGAQFFNLPYTDGVFRRAKSEAPDNIYNSIR